MEGPAPPSLVAHRVRGIVFDLDGTLVDSYEAIAESLNFARASFGLAPLDVGLVRTRVGRGLETLIEELVGRDRVDAGVRAFRRRYAEVFSGRTHALPGVAPTLRALHAHGYRMGVASNKPARFGERILEELDLLRYLVSVQGPDRVGSTKPDPRMLERCLEELGLGPECVVYVGDMVLDVESAARAGLAVLLVPGGSSSESELRATGQPVLDSFESLLDLLSVPG